LQNADAAEEIGPWLALWRCTGYL